jgi:hypothetical protein
MKPRFAQLMTGVLIALAALAACRKEVPPPPTPIPKPDKDPQPTVQARQVASASPAVFRVV